MKRALRPCCEPVGIFRLQCQQLGHAAWTPIRCRPVSFWSEWRARLKWRTLHLGVWLYWLYFHVKAVEHHDFVPGLGEGPDKALVAIAACENFDNGT